MLGRKKVDDIPAVTVLRDEWDAADRKMRVENERAKTYLDEVALKCEFRKAKAIVDAKNVGVSLYAIGIVTGKTSHKYRAEIVEWAFQFVAQFDKMQKELEVENAAFES